MRALTQVSLALALLLGVRPASAVEALSATESVMAEGLVAEVRAQLPDAWARAPHAQPRIEWTDALPAHVHGRALRGRVLLRRALLAAVVSAPDATTRDRARGVVQAALVHELAHLLDRSDLGGLSRDPRLLDLAGWQVRPLAGRSSNAFRLRSPDAYERARPAEFVATNLERYVLDPEYACRRPALHAYFNARLGAPRIAAARCAAGHAFVQSSAVHDGSPALLEIAPERVAEVDYLLAEPGRGAMSRWGHGMLRLVICAPGRPRGPDCRLDLAHHRVLSFRAFVDDVQISNWKGLTGAYPSRLFVLPLNQVVDEYTKVELRGLRSVPLRLSRDEIDALLERAAQVHWSYDGRYRFVGNNCAVETWKLLHDGVPRLAALPVAAITPTGLLTRLRRTGVADPAPLADPDAARRLGYAFDSQEAHYATLLAGVRNALDLPVRDVRGWLALDPEARRPWIDRADLRATAALLVLETAAQRRQEHLALDALKRRLLGGAVQRSAGTRATDVLRLADRLSRPSGLLDDPGYGLPHGVERERLRSEGDRVAADWRAESEALRIAAREWLPPAQRRALDATAANVARLGERVRRLHREAGGLRLD
ncbi:DUF7844 domain-containing protein [Lysobacter humi (ex Lee et al. 2017)]